MTGYPRDHRMVWRPAEDRDFGMQHDENEMIAWKHQKRSHSGRCRGEPSSHLAVKPKMSSHGQGGDSSIFGNRGKHNSERFVCVFEERQYQLLPNYTISEPARLVHYRTWGKRSLSRAFNTVIWSRGWGERTWRQIRFQLRRVIMHQVAVTCDCAAAYTAGHEGGWYAFSRIKGVFVVIMYLLLHRKGIVFTDYISVYNFNYSSKC